MSLFPSISVSFWCLDANYAASRNYIDMKIVTLDSIPLLSTKSGPEHRLNYQSDVEDSKLKSALGTVIYNRPTPNFEYKFYKPSYPISMNATSDIQVTQAVGDYRRATENLQYELFQIYMNETAHLRHSLFKKLKVLPSKNELKGAELLRNFGADLNSIMPSGEMEAYRTSEEAIEKLGDTMFLLLRRVDLRRVTVKESRHLLEKSTGIPPGELSSYRTFTTRWVREFVNAEPSVFGMELLLKPFLFPTPLTSSELREARQRHSENNTIGERARASLPTLSLERDGASQSITQGKNEESKLVEGERISTIRGPFGWVCPSYPIPPLRFPDILKDEESFNISRHKQNSQEEIIAQQFHPWEDAVRHPPAVELDLAFYIPSRNDDGLHIFTSSRTISRFSPVMRRKVVSISREDRADETLRSRSNDQGLHALLEEFGPGLNRIPVFRLPPDLHVDSIILILQLLDPISYGFTISSIRASGTGVISWIHMAKVIIGALRLIKEWELFIPGLYFFDEALRLAVGRIAQRAKLYKDYNRLLATSSKESIRNFDELESLTTALNLTLTSDVIRMVRSGRKVDIETGVDVSTLYMKRYREFLAGKDPGATNASAEIRKRKVN